MGFAHLACLEAAIKGRTKEGAVVDNEKKTYHLEKGIEYLKMRAEDKYVKWNYEGGKIPRWMYGVAPSEGENVMGAFLGMWH